MLFLQFVFVYLQGCFHVYYTFLSVLFHKLLSIIFISQDSLLLYALLFRLFPFCSNPSLSFLTLLFCMHFLFISFQHLILFLVESQFSQKSSTRFLGFLIIFLTWPVLFTLVNKPLCDATHIIFISFNFLLLFLLVSFVTNLFLSVTNLISWKFLNVHSFLFIRITLLTSVYLHM